ncbi:phosphoenolpyruvate carboxylase, partial [Salmonella enterica]|uniref:phosphoenolpyruvate carboxylase n=1 Tax=Salmonella enterica TaxID=28901 RepID=UPI00329975CC
LGSWIGGDRDGNPNVTADSLELALKSASEAVLTSYLDQLHELGAEISVSVEHATVSSEVMKLAAESGDTNPGRADEPYRRAVIGMYSRLAATFERLVGHPPARRASTSAPPYLTAEEVRADLL